MANNFTSWQNETGSLSDAFVDNPLYYLHPSGEIGPQPQMLRDVSGVGASPLSNHRSLQMAMIAMSCFASIALGADASLARSLFPTGVSIPVSEPIERRSLDSQGMQSIRLLSRLVASIGIAPVEDGIVHPAEDMLTQLLHTSGSQKLFEYMFRTTAQSQSRAAALLRLLGRIDVPDSSFRSQLVRTGLASSNIQVREAAVSAVELWGDHATAILLERHRENTPWLADYIDRVVRDIRA